MRMLITATFAALTLAGCGERPQELAGGRVKASAPDWQGPSTSFTAAGWKVGDQTSFDSHMKARAQSQNEFVRIGTDR